MDIKIAEKYNAFKTKKGNIIWSGCMSIAWKDFIDVNTKKPLVFKTTNTAAQKEIENFNNSQFSYEDVDEKCVYVKTGHGKQTQNLINRQVKDRFKGYSFSALNQKLSPLDIISFAYLFKKIDFECKFQKKNNGFLFNGKPVKAFQAIGQAQKRQVKVIQYKNTDRFCIKINDRLTSDSLYLIKNNKIITVDKVIEVVAQSQKIKEEQMNKKDLFQMPIIDLSVFHQFKELIGLQFENPQLKGYTLSVICEALKVKVDETGALIENRAYLTCTKSCVPKKQQPRQFILDKTFWLVMKEAGNHPYLCVLVNSPIDTLQ